jgi:hypothetical protein
MVCYTNKETDDKRDRQLASEYYGNPPYNGFLGVFSARYTKRKKKN